jgi:hypothetical protein
MQEIVDKIIAMMMIIMMTTTTIIILSSFLSNCRVRDEAVT